MRLEDLFAELAATFEMATDAQIHAMLTYVKDLVDRRVRIASPEGLLEQHHALFRLTDKGKALLDALEEKVPR